MTDLAAERAAVLAKREKEKAEIELRARVRAVRRALAADRGHMNGGQPVPKTTEEAARQLFPDLSENQLAEIIERANEPVDRGRTVSTIETSRVREITKAYLREHPDAGNADVWQHIIRQGQPTIRESSFRAMIVGPVRKELGIKAAMGPKPRTEGEPLPSRPRPRRREQAERPKPSKSERAARLKLRAAAEVPVGDDVRSRTKATKKNGNGKHAAPVVNEGSATAAVVRVEPVEPHRMVFQDGDRITIELGGEKLDARRMGGRWTCDVGDSVLEGFLGRVLAGVGR